MKLLCSHVLVNTSPPRSLPVPIQTSFVCSFALCVLEYSGMGFGAELWCPQAHTALVRLLDSELHLMEVMKKWMGQRAKSEREFSVQLHSMGTMVEKLDRSQHGAGVDYISQLNKVRAAPAGPPVCV